LFILLFTVFVYYKQKHSRNECFFEEMSDKNNTCIMQCIKRSIYTTLNLIIVYIYNLTKLASYFGSRWQQLAAYMVSHGDQEMSVFLKK
jgi:glucose-6-phosphate isomerase